jgi:TonB family protein
VGRSGLTGWVDGDIQLRAIETANMNEEWKQWEGRTVDGKFALGRYLGGSDHSAVFLTIRNDERGGSESAAIKLIPAGADAEKQLERWRTARDLEHPNLIRIFETGRPEVDRVGILYVVEESAEENLAQILPERALTAEETRMMLPPVLGALQYLHGRELVHGRIQPSNILAIGEQVKLSSDSVGAPGELKGAAVAYDPPEAATGADSAASDVWRLGMTLVEVLTQRLPNWDHSKTIAPEIPAGVSEPFREIAERCLQVEPAKRWTVAEIAARLETGRSAGAAASQMQASHEQMVTSAGAVVSARENVGGRQLPAPGKAARWPYLVLLAAVVAVILFLMTRARTPNTADGTATEGASSSAPQSSTQTGVSPTQPESQAGTAPKGDNNGVVRRVMPEVSPSARRTIQGTIKIRVRVDVDSAGNVTTAKLESAGPSKYFSRVALEAARQWKFSPLADGTGAREWKLQFAFNRARTEASALRAKR